jgi:AbrB family looped-hinge helix DNA binding protein
MEHIVAIDPAGRVVIPKAVRDALHLHGGTRLRIVQKFRSLVLEPIQEEPVLLVRDGMTLIGGELEGPALDYHALAREARLDELVKRVTPRR